MSAREFKALIDDCASEMEVRRVYHYYFRHLQGSTEVKALAHQYADAKAEQLIEQAELVNA